MNVTAKDQSPFSMLVYTVKCEFLGCARQWLLFIWHSQCGRCHYWIKRKRRKQITLRKVPIVMTHKVTFAMNWIQLIIFAWQKDCKFKTNNRSSSCPYNEFLFVNFLKECLLKRTNNFFFINLLFFEKTLSFTPFFKAFDHCKNREIKKILKNIHPVIEKILKINC